MKTFSKILNRPDQVIGSLTKQALLNQYYTKILQKYLPKELKQDAFVSNYQNGILIIAASYNEKLTILKYATPDLIINLRKDSNFTGLVTIKAIINQNPPKALKTIIEEKEKQKQKNQNFLSKKASENLNHAAIKIKYEKLKQALLKLSQHTKPY